MTKPRKPLTDSVAEKFVFGSPTPGTPTEPEVQQPAAAPAEEGGSKRQAFLDKLQQEPKEATVRLTVDMPKSMHLKLSILAAKTGQKKANIVRVLLEEKLNELEESE